MWNWKTLVSDLVGVLLGWTTKNVQAEVDDLVEEAVEESDEGDE